MSSIANPQLDGMTKMAFALVSIALVSFSLYTAMFGVFPDMIQRGAHLSAVIALVYIRFFGFSAPGAGPLGIWLESRQISYPWRGWCRRYRLSVLFL